MIRRLLTLGTVATGAAAVADRWLASRSDGEPPRPIRSQVTIDAPLERVWEVASDILEQPRWMHEMKSVRLLTAPPVGEGTRAEAVVTVVGISVTTAVTIAAWDPPTRLAVQHDGPWTGSGEIVLEPVADGAATRLIRDEALVPPVLPHLGAIVQRPVLAAIFHADLERLRRLVEAGG